MQGEFMNRAAMANQNEGNQEVESNRQTSNVHADNSIFTLASGGVSNPLFQMTTGEYSDFLIKLKEKIEVDSKELIEKRGLKIKFHFIDKNNPATSTACSAIVASLKDNDRIFYYFFMLSCTGKDTMTSGELMSTFENNMKMLSQPTNNTYIKQNVDHSYRTLDAYIDDNFFAIILKEVANDYNVSYNSVEWVSVGGSITSPLMTSSQIEEATRTIMRTAITDIMAEKTIYYDKTQRDLDVQNDIVSASRDYNFNIQIKHNPTNSKSEPIDANHNPIRQDFKVQLHALKKAAANTIQSYNRVDNDKILCEASGYVTALPYAQSMMSVNPGFPTMAVTKPRLAPHIIITDTTAPIPTLRFKLLSIAVACNMLDPNNYLQSLFNNIGTKNDPGFLNYITNIYDCEKQQDVTAIDFKSMKSNQEAYGTLKTMFTGQPIISLDILPYTAQSHIDKTFATAAISSDNAERHAALEDIITSAIELTNGKFPAQFDRNKIFAYQPIPFPVGYTSINNIIKDIRNIDLAFVCGNIKNDQNALHTFLRSEAPQGAEFDPFFGKIKTLTTIGDRGAVITSRGTRITFHAEFITTLVKSIQEAGLIPSYVESTSFQANDFSYQGYESFFQNAIIGAGNVFGSPTMANPMTGGSQFIYSSFGR